MKSYAQVGVVPFDNALTFVSRVGKVAQAQFLSYTGGIYNKGATITTSSMLAIKLLTSNLDSCLIATYKACTHTYTASVMHHIGDLVRRPCGRRKVASG